MFTHYEDMEGNAECRNWGGLEGLGVPPRSSVVSPFDRAHAIFYSTLIEKKLQKLLKKKTAEKM